MRADPIAIRAAGLADLASIVEIEAASFPSPWDAEVYRPEVQRPEAVFLVAEHQGAVAGYVLGWSVLDEAHILKLAVRADLRRRGIANALLDALVHRLRERQVLTLWLEARAPNRAARAFYLARGFVELGRRRKYYSDTGDDAVIMMRNLDAS